MTICMSLSYTSTVNAELVGIKQRENDLSPSERPNLRHGLCFPHPASSDDVQ